MLSRSLRALAIVLPLFSFPPAHAALVTFSYEGRISHVDLPVDDGSVIGEELFGPFLGAKLRMDYTFDPDTPVHPDRGEFTQEYFYDPGQFVGAVTHYRLTAGPKDSPLLEASESPFFSAIGVSALGPSSPDYMVFVEGSPSGTDLWDEESGRFFPVLYTLLQFRAPGPPVLDPDAIPLTPPEPSAFGSVSITIYLAETQYDKPVRLDVTDLQIVPEPGTAVLLGLSGLWLGGGALRRRRRAGTARSGHQ